MGALRCAVAALALFMASPAAAEEAGDWTAYIAEASARFGVPEPWIRRVLAIESGGRTLIDGRPIRSPKGAMGLMQLMPETWRAMRDAHGLGADPDDPHDNILAGTAYLRLMYDRFGYPGLFGAYNAGPGRYAAALSGTAALPRETKDYLERAAGAQPQRPPQRVERLAPPPLFAVDHRADAPPAARGDAPSSEGSLIAIRRD